MKLLIIGGSSVIGLHLVKYFINSNHDVKFTYFNNDPKYCEGEKLNIEQKDETVNLIKKIDPDVVIHTASLTDVDKCESNRELGYEINVNGTSHVIDGCKQTNSKFVYVSSSHVFSDDKHRLNESDVPNPSTYYGITKYLGEQMTINSGLPYLILRTDQPYFWHEKWQHTNSVLRVLTTLSSNQIFKEIVDWYNCPTYIPDFVVATEKLLLKNLNGIFHVVGQDFLNRYDWSKVVANIFGLNESLIQPVSSSSLNLSAKRPNINLNNSKLFENTGFKMKGVREGCIEMYKQKQQMFK